jgi:hypothetical protein
MEKSGKPLSVPVMGLTNAPAMFQHFMNDSFYDLLDRFVAAYLDDLIIYTEPDPNSGFPALLKKHIVQVREVLLHCRTNGLFANPKKCEFHVDSISEARGDLKYPTLNPTRVYSGLREVGYKRCLT